MVDLIAASLRLAARSARLFPVFLFG